MTQQAIQDTAPAFNWEAEVTDDDDFELSAEAAEVPLACNLGEECTACQ